MAMLLGQTVTNYDQLLFAALAIVFMFGSAIVGWIKKKMDETAEVRRRQERLARGESPEESDANVDDAVARRREQLRELARQRAAGQGSGEPQNLTMAERIARARAKEQYRERSASLQTPAEAARRQAMEQAAAQREAVRRQREEEMRRRQEEVERRRREAAQRRQPQRAQQTPPQRRPTVQPAPRRPVVAPPPAPVTRQPEPIETPTFGSARPVVSSPAAEAAKPSSTRRMIPGLRGVSLRDAFVAKEILDRPVAMRVPFSEREF